MSDEIKVVVVKYPDRDNLVLRYVDPSTGKQKTKSAKTASMNAARKAAGAWEDQLRNGAYQPKNRTTWQAFRDRYDREHLDSLSTETRRKSMTIFDSFEAAAAPVLLRDVTTDRLSTYAATLRERGLAEPTIAQHMAHMKAALRWAGSLGLLREVPKVPKLKGARQQRVMKGRPVTGEEFDRMLAKTAAVVGEAAAESWQRFLRGLWTSGLRLGEAIGLYWDRDDRLCVDLDGKRPMLGIPAALEKGGKDRILPVAPEFAELLLATPEAERRGRVFKLAAKSGGGLVTHADHVSKAITAIGEKAKVKVASRTKLATQDDGSKARVESVKWASAHDLRRSFGERWAKLVMPQVLMELMRDETMDTTLRYYVGKNAQRTADVLWEVHEKAGNKSGNSAEKQTSESSVSTGRGGT